MEKQLSLADDRSSMTGGNVAQLVWHTATDPDEMLVLLDDLASDRKLRLLCCACTRRIWYRLAISDISRRAVDFAEEYADGLRTAEEMSTISKLADDTIDDAASHQEVNAIRAAAWCVNANMDTLSVTRSALWSVAYASQETEEDERTAQGQLVRDIFSSVFKPKSLDSTQITSTVTALAHQMYETRDFGAMPILADALQDAGCDDADILNHCRGPGPHVRGCWVVDLILGKK